jgi:hypothetical protein
MFKYCRHANTVKAFPGVVHAIAALQAFYPLVPVIAVVLQRCMMWPAEVLVSDNLRQRHVEIHQ